MRTTPRLLLICACLGAAWLSAPVPAQKPIPDEYRIHGLAVGTQAYTFHRFSLFEAIEKTAQAGGRVIELYPGQRLSPEQPNVRFDHNASDEIIQSVLDKLKQHDILPVNYGVVGLPDNEQESRQVFEFARRMGLRAVTSEARSEAMDLIERLVKEYDIMMGIHNHPPRPNDPAYRHWDPEFILSLVEGRDPRLGACVDTGHYARSGLKPVEVLKRFEGRVISLHLKDIEPFARRGVDVPFGAGQSDIPAILDELKRQNFQGNISIEYENNLEHNVPDVAQCVGFIRGYTARWNAASGQTAGTGPSFKGPVGLQLYSLRGEFIRNVPATLEKVRDYGFKKVELAGTYNLSAGRFKQLLDQNGLVPIGGHFPYERWKNDLEAVVQEARTLGLKYAGCAWIEHEGAFDEAACREGIRVFNRAGQALAQHGIKFIYHVHGYEFHPHQDATLLDLLIARTNPEHVLFQMDVYWVVHPGQDPVRLLRQYPERWVSMHLKDMRKGVQGDLSGRSDVTTNVPLGTGQMDWPAILEAAQAAGVKYYFIEDESPWVGDQIPQSLRYLEQLRW